MAYTALPDRRMPYDIDGTVVGFRESQNQNWTEGIAGWFTGGQLAEMNDADAVTAVGSSVSNEVWKLWWWFPEQRTLTALGMYFGVVGGFGAVTVSPILQGSNDTSNGMDGTWEQASLPSGFPAYSQETVTDYWRSTIRPVSFTGAKKVLRWLGGQTGPSAQGGTFLEAFHLYGAKAGGQTPDDIVFINHDDTPGVEYTAPEDFGDRPLGTTAVRQWRIKNVSPTKTANAIILQCNDTDFSISEDSVTWVVTINRATLVPGAESPTYYVRCTTPAAGNLLGPRFARIVATVGSWT